MVMGFTTMKFGGGGVKHDPYGGALALEYEIPAAETTIELAIKAAADWFDAGQDVSIDWGDGTTPTVVNATSGQSGYIGHTYTTAGTYTIKISGSMKMYGRSALADIAGQGLLTRVDSFGKLGITSFRIAFYRCTGLISVPKTLPDSVTNMSYMLRNCSGTAFNPDVSNWNVGKVTDMSYMFQYCSGAAFRGGRGVDGNGIANWRLKTGNNAVNMGLFMASSKIQATPFLDGILNAWADLHAQGLLPTNITVHFGTNKYTAVGNTAYTTLTTVTGSGGAGWTITSGGLQA